MEYLPQVKVTREDYLVLSELAGDMSIMEYMSNIIHEHVANIEADVKASEKMALLLQEIFDEGYGGEYRGEMNLLLVQYNATKTNK